MSKQASNTVRKLPPLTPTSSLPALFAMGLETDEDERPRAAEKCPICGRCALAVNDTNGVTTVVHSFAFRLVRSTATGKDIQCQVPVDVCRREK